MTVKNITLTGHRPNQIIPKGEKWSMAHPMAKEYGKAMRKELLRQAGFNLETKEWDKEQPVKLISGMAIGVDTIGALVLLKLKQQFPELFFLECAVPCLGQESKWNKEDQKRYWEILNQADEVTYVSKERYTHGCMQRRNEYMVDQASVILAVWNGMKSGTGNCVIYALEEGKPVTLIEPMTLNVGILS